MNLKTFHSNSLSTSFPALDVVRFDNTTMKRLVLTDDNNGLEEKEKSSRYESGNSKNFDSVNSSD